MAARRTATLTHRPVIICTEFKGVFFGYASDTTGVNVMLKGARMAIYWGGNRGVLRLAEVGPQTGDRISARADMDIRKITAVMEVTEAAAKAWEAA
jgi:hypothetical protein